MKNLILTLVALMIVLSLALVSCAPEENNDEDTSGDVTVDDPADLPPPEDTESPEDDSNDDEGLKVGDIENSPPPSVDFDELQ